MRSARRDDNEHRAAWRDIGDDLTVARAWRSLPPMLAREPLEEFGHNSAAPRWRPRPVAVRGSRVALPVELLCNELETDGRVGSNRLGVARG